MSAEQTKPRQAGAMKDEDLLAAWEIKAADGDPCAKIRVAVLRERVRESRT